MITTPMIVTIATAPKTTILSSCEGSKTSRVCWMNVGILVTIPAKINSEMPLPIFFSEISSPIHIRNIVPAVTVTMVINSRHGVRSGRMFTCDLRNRAIKP